MSTEHETLAATNFLRDVLVTGEIAVLTRSVAPSGFSHRVTVLTTRSGSIIDITRSVAVVLGLPLDATNTARLNGVGMDKDIHQYLGNKLATVLDLKIRTVTL